MRGDAGEQGADSVMIDGEGAEDSERDLLDGDDDIPLAEEEIRRLQAREELKRATLRRLQQIEQDHLRALDEFEQGEKEYVENMDQRMEEVAHTEHVLTQRIESLELENVQLKVVAEQRVRDNQVLNDKLSETTRHCNESETRVQFLVDRIVALLSTQLPDPAQTEVVVSMRRQERELIRTLDESRQNLDEVKHQNGELTSRLDEELNLSRRLQDQLYEVKEQFYQNARPLGGGLARAGRPGPLRAGCPDAAVAGPADELDLPEARCVDVLKRPPPPDLPQTISESEVLPDSPLNFGSEDDYTAAADLSTTLGRTPSPPRADGAHALDRLEAAAQHPGAPMSHWPATGSPPSPPSPAGPVPSFPSAWTSPNGGAPAASAGVRSPSPPTGEALQAELLEAQPQAFSRAPSADAVLLMEQRLREVLDQASFEHAVVRVEAGIYDFGENVRAQVRLTDNDEVVACSDGRPWERVEDFIQTIAREIRQSAAANFPRLTGVTRMDLGPPAPGDPCAPGSNFGSGTYLSDGSVEIPAGGADWAQDAGGVRAQAAPIIVPVEQWSGQWVLAPGVASAAQPQQQQQQQTPRSAPGPCVVTPHSHGAHGGSSQVAAIARRPSPQAGLERLSAPSRQHQQPHPPSAYSQPFQGGYPTAGAVRQVMSPPRH